MARAHGTTNGTPIEIEYETFGDAGDIPLLLVNGFTSQMTAWESELCHLLAGHGLHVIRYDNRDVGLSTHFDGQRVAHNAILAARRDEGPMPALPYTLADMATDGMLVLDDLGLESAHIAGMSMGGMIVQLMAIDHPARVRSLISIMSTTGNPKYGRSTTEANAALMSAPPSGRVEYIAKSVEDRRLWASSRYFDPVREAARLGRDYDRCFYPEGAARQLAAIMATPPRDDALAALDVPTLVIHGRQDTLITLSGGEHTAELIPGATLTVLNDMSHDLPQPLWDEYADAFVGLIRRAEARRSAQ